MSAPSNVRLIPNLICYRVEAIGDGSSKLERNQREVAKRLDLLRIGRACTVRTQSSSRNPTLTTPICLDTSALSGMPSSVSVPQNLSERLRRHSIVALFGAIAEGAQPPDYRAASERNRQRRVSVQPQQVLAAESEPDDVPAAHETDDEIQDEQDRVIQAPVRSNMLVLAPPGTGKTHVLINRLCHLLRSGEFESPADEIQVLSFSRAAVGVVRGRVAEKLEVGAEDDLRYINVRTFDSYATQLLLLDIDHEQIVRLSRTAPGSSSFDQRIGLCSRMLEKERCTECVFFD